MRIHIRLQRAMAVGSALWFGGIALWMLSAGWLVATGRGTFHGPAWLVALPFAMLAFGYAVMSVSFWSEVAKARSILLERLPGTIQSASRDF